MARLDRLGPAKEIIQIGAVIGSEFSYELLQAVHPIAEASLQQALSRWPTRNCFTFAASPPMRPTSSSTLSFAMRPTKRCSRAAARSCILSSLAPSMRSSRPLKETHPEVLARHWTEAGEIESAITEWTRAGKAARSATLSKRHCKSYQRAVSLITLFPVGRT